MGDNQWLESDQRITTKAFVLDPTHHRIDDDGVIWDGDKALGWIVAWASTDG